MIGLILIKEFLPLGFVWVFNPFLETVVLLGKVSYVAIIRVFVIKDYGDGLVVGYNFGNVYSSGVACPFFIFLYGFLGMSHL